MSTEDQELNEILSSNPESSGRVKLSRSLRNDSIDSAEGNEDKFTSKSVQWATSGGSVFVPTGRTVQTLKPGVYEIGSHPNIGIYFEKIPVKTEGVIDFPEATTHKVVNEIKSFWEKGDQFDKYGLTHKRGIILWGPPGGGKSCTLQLVCKDVIERGGVVIKFTSPDVFSIGIRKFREIQPNTPVVVLMEDIDATLEIYNESTVINLLDGVDRVDKIVFLATTNYPEKLGTRIMNRPSRFDKRFKVGYPTDNTRKIYLEHLIQDEDIDNLNIDIEQWVKDTDKFSIAHLKELFVAVVIMGDPYNQALETLKSMKNLVSSNGDEDKQKVGFRGA